MRGARATLVREIADGHVHLGQYGSPDLRDVLRVSLHQGMTLVILPFMAGIRRVKLKNSVSFAGSEYLALLPEMKKPACALAWWGRPAEPIGIIARAPGGETVYVPLGNVISVLEDNRPAEVQPKA